jgi:hypothetical protein
LGDIPSLRSFSGGVAQCFVGKHVFPLFFVEFSASETDGDFLRFS